VSTRLARGPAVSRRVETVRAALHHRRIVLGVDVLDRSQGILEKLLDRSHSSA
jgi:trehalose-6-phosphate synthase